MSRIMPKRSSKNRIKTENEIDSSTQTLRIKNIVKQQKTIQRKIEKSSLNYTNLEITKIEKELTNWTQEID